jgi:hypothetical protein
MADLLECTGIRYFALSRPLIRQPDLPDIWKKIPQQPSSCISCDSCRDPSGGIVYPYRTCLPDDHRDGTRQVLTDSSGARMENTLEAARKTAGSINRYINPALRYIAVYRAPGSIPGAVMLRPGPDNFRGR